MPKGAANSGTMRLSSQGNLGQTMNPTMVNEGSPRLGANPVRVSGRSYLIFEVHYSILGIPRYELEDLYGQVHNDSFRPRSINQAV